MNQYLSTIALAILLAACGGGERAEQTTATAPAQTAQTVTTAPDPHAGMDHSKHGGDAAVVHHSGHGMATTMDHSAHAGHGGAAPAPANPHAGHGTTAPNAKNPHAGHGAAAMTDHSAHAGHGAAAPAARNAHAGHGATAPAATDAHAGHGTAAPADHSAHAGHGATAPAAPNAHAGHAQQQPAADPHAAHRGGTTTAAAPITAPSSSGEMAAVRPSATLARDEFDAPAAVSVAEAARAAGGESAAPPAADGVYVCPMHPEVTSAAPGECPRCGMALVKRNQQ